MWKGQKVSVAFSTYNEKDSIRKVIQGFFDTGVVDEVIAVNNNAAEGTTEEIKKTKAKLVFEKKPGFGHGTHTALCNATGDLIVMCEPDGTFEPNDIFKVLAYTDDFDLVLGTRTDYTMIGKGANMGLHLRWGNILYAKFVELLYNSPRLSDIGCVYRAMKREVFDTIKDDLTDFDGTYDLDLALLAMRHGFSFKEIPLNYYQRVGESCYTGSKIKTIKLAIEYMILIMKHRFGIIKIGHGKKNAR